jgi:hypothetical protein
MLTLTSPITRRGFLHAGIASLALPPLSRQRAIATEPTRSETAVILIFLSGGPSQHDTFDPKPDAVAEVRSPFASIATAVPGVRVTELFPLLARQMDRISIVRSVHHTDGSHHHSSHWMHTGVYPPNLQFYVNQRPAVGAVAAKNRGPTRPGMPPYVSMPRAGFNYAGPAHLGTSYTPFDAGDPNLPTFYVPNLKLGTGLTAESLADRQQLLGSFDRTRRDLDASGTMAAMDGFQRSAVDLVMGKNARDAFDIGREDTRLRDRYGRTRIGQSLLLARRLVAAGVTFVLYEDYEFVEWDLHGIGANQCVTAGTRIKGPHLDRAFSALLDDLDDRGMLDRTLVVAFGEFGRTPKINGNGGRDHWGNVFSVLFAGGGLRHGQTIGASTSNGDFPRDRPMGPQSILATIYHVLGIDPRMTHADASGRPIQILDEPEPIREMVGS